MPPTSIDHIPGRLFDTSHDEEIECDGCMACLHHVDLDALLPQARKEYDRLLEGICSEQ